MRLKTLHPFRVIVFLIAFFILGTGFGYWSAQHNLKLNLTKAEVKINRIAPEDKEDIDFLLFWQVWDKLSQKFIDKTALKPRQMVYGAIQGMTAALGDPYTVFLAPEENTQSKEDLGGAFEGVGIELGYDKNGVLQVVSPLDGMPAKKAGVRTGDLILKIDGQSTEGLSLPEAVKQIRGAKTKKTPKTSP